MGTDDITRKIQGLLRKAEGTDNENEAEAFYAKAQDLMLRYAIDEARLRDLEGAQAAKAKPVKITVDFDWFYAQAKIRMISLIAKANRCKVIINPMAQRLDRKARQVYVIGYERDVENVQILFVSILLQATRAGKAEYKVRLSAKAFDHAAEPGWSGDYCTVCHEPIREGRSGFTHKVEGQTKFLTSFIYGYAETVGQRLMERNDAMRREDPTGMALVDLSRERVDEAVNEFFPSLGRGRKTSIRGTGWGAGQRAGHNADIGNPGVGAGRRQIGA